MNKTNSIPSYIRVQEAVRKKILDGYWKPGDRIPAEKELVDEFKLSRITVSKGLSNLVSEGLIIRRQGQGTFVASDANKPDAQKHLVAYISPFPSSGLPFRHGALEAMNEVLVPFGYDTGVDFYRSADEMAECLKRSANEYHAGFVVHYTPGEKVDAELANMKSQGYPFALIDAYPEDCTYDFVVSDNITGGSMLAEHLVEMGHRNICYITRPADRSSLNDRLAGYIKGLVKCGVPFSDKSIVQLASPGDGALPEVRDAVDAVLALPNPPTAICFSNDDLAIRAMDYLMSKGVRIPEDVSVLGYDNIDISNDLKVPLSSIAQDYFEMAKSATNILLLRVDGSDMPFPLQVFMKPKLVRRSSVLCIK